MQNFMFRLELYQLKIMQNYLLQQLKLSFERKFN